MFTSYRLSRHAEQRTQQRGLPRGVIDLIIDFGAARDAGRGATKHSLTKDSLRSIRHCYGRGIAEAMNRYRDAYVICSGPTIITAICS